MSFPFNLSGSMNFKDYNLDRIDIDKLSQKIEQDFKSYGSSSFTKKENELSFDIPLGAISFFKKFSFFNSGKIKIVEKNDELILNYSLNCWISLYTIFIMCIFLAFGSYFLHNMTLIQSLILFLGFFIFLFGFNYLIKINSIKKSIEDAFVNAIKNSSK